MEMRCRHLLLLGFIFLMGTSIWSASFSPKGHSRRSQEPLRLLLVSMEYIDPVFSGNGIYARSIAQSLAALGCHIKVICGFPQAEGSDKAVRHVTQQGIQVQAVPLSTWYRLDMQSDWQGFAEGTKALWPKLRSFHPHAVLGVDWSGMRVLQDMALGHSAPIFLCFRVYSASPALADEQQAISFYTKMEQAAIDAALVTIGLTKQDVKLLDKVHPKPYASAVLLPPLREEVRRLAVRVTRTTGRQYLVCCVRLAKEKNALLFAEVVVELGAFLAKAGIRPLLCGAAVDHSYAHLVRKKLDEAAVKVHIVDKFLGPKQLADIYKEAVFNFHPALYDAYAMTVIEAAAFGVPSMMNKDGSVGASELLPSPHLSFEEDLTKPVPEIAAALQHILEDNEQRTAVGVAARKKSLSWTEEANAAQLIQIVTPYVKGDG